ARVHLLSLVSDAAQAYLWPLRTPTRAALEDVPVLRYQRLRHADTRRSHRRGRHAPRAPSARRLGARRGRRLSSTTTYLDAGVASAAYWRHCAQDGRVTVHCRREERPDVD